MNKTKVVNFRIPLVEYYILTYFHIIPEKTAHALLIEEAEEYIQFILNDRDPLKKMLELFYKMPKVVIRIRMNIKTYELYSNQAKKNNTTLTDLYLSHMHDVIALFYNPNLENWGRYYPLFQYIANNEDFPVFSFIIDFFETGDEFYLHKFTEECARFVQEKKL